MSSHGGRGLLREGRGTTGASLIVPIERREWVGGCGTLGVGGGRIGVAACLGLDARGRL